MDEKSLFERIFGNPNVPSSSWNDLFGFATVEERIDVKPNPESRTETVTPKTRPTKIVVDSMNVRETHEPKSDKDHLYLKISGVTGTLSVIGTEKGIVASYREWDRYRVFYD